MSNPYESPPKLIRNYLFVGLLSYVPKGDGDGGSRVFTFKPNSER